MAQNFNLNLNLFQAAIEVVNDLAAKAPEGEFFLDEESWKTLEGMAFELGRIYADEVVREEMAKAGRFTFDIPSFHKQGTKPLTADTLEHFQSIFQRGLGRLTSREGNVITVTRRSGW